jgi:hypothetical protein
MTWRERFGMHNAPLPRGAAGESFFERDPHYQRLARAFCWLATEPGLGVLTGEPGVGKSAAIRHLCRALHPDEHRVLYLSDCAVKPLDLYRMLAAELGLRPSARAQIVADIKRALVDEAPRSLPHARPCSQEVSPRSEREPNRRDPPSAERSRMVAAGVIQEQARYLWTCTPRSHPCKI